MKSKDMKKLIIKTFENSFNKENFILFLKNLLKSFEEKTFKYQGQYIPDSFKEYINSFERIGKYNNDDKEIDLLIVELKKGHSIERSRSLQRNFIAWYLKGSRNKLKDAALVAFISPESEDWRFSFVKMEYKFEETPSGRIKVKEEFTPAKRWSFLVGKNENSHTAQSRFLPLLEDDDIRPTIETLEKAFDVEVVTKDFYEKYRDLFIRIKIELDNIVNKNQKVKTEFESKKINTVDFAKKLLGQITFLYFLQKKGWFGVEKGNQWGTGPKDFIRKLFNKEFGDYKNFYNDILEPLFYEALRTDRSTDDHYFSRFNCKIPFLNGGLFDPYYNFDWVNTDIFLPDELFSNKKTTKEKDIGDGILDVFDRYNFTVSEEEPLEKEIALDPELLGKIYEKLNAIREDNFNEYLEALNSSKKGDETKFNKEYGVYYTPREIVHYMCQESLINYLATNLKTLTDAPGSSEQTKNNTGNNQENCVSIKEIEEFVKYADNIFEHEKTAIQKKDKIQKGEIKETIYEHKISENIIKNAKLIDDLLSNVKVCDPAIGSGAFPIGMMHEIVKLRQLLAVYLEKQTNTYDLKRYCIENSIYGVDIDPGAVEICKLRFWLSMVVDEENFYNIKPLPNLDYKIVCGNSLLEVEKNLFNHNDLIELEKLKSLHFNETNSKKKQEYNTQINKLIESITYGHTQFDFKVYFSEVFNQKGGFDIVIGNPPYISTKGIKQEIKEQLQKYYGFADDIYNHFFFKSMEILKENGILTFITSKTFWTIQTKKNLRELLLKNKIIVIFDTANPFENAMVDTSITIVKKAPALKEDTIKFLDGKQSIIEPEKYTIPQINYLNAPNKVFFIPTDYNKKIYEKFGKKVNELLTQWWEKISTSKNIEKYKRELEEYRKSLRPGDITLLGLITEGGQGLATANNGKYIGVLDGTKWAENVRKQRPEKLLLATEFCKKENIKNKADANQFLNTLSEQEIRQLFERLKEKYGRDIFGQGWLYRIVNENEIADVDKLTEDEKLNGIVGIKTFVPYDKGDKDGNRWYAPTPYYIDWSRENVKFLQTDPKARWQGYQFYFREGFCWSFALLPQKQESMFIKARIKIKSINDVMSMAMYNNYFGTSNKYFVSILNSKFMYNYLKYFVNSTAGQQLNDFRQLPIIIPTVEQLKQFEEIFNRAYQIQKSKFEGNISEKEAEAKLYLIQKELDEIVEEIYLK